MSLRPGRRSELALLVAVVAVGAALRLLQPGADVPGRAELTDAPIQDALWYLEAATWPAEGLPRDLEPFPIYDPPVWVHAARVWFACVGVSLGAAQALGALLSLVTVLLVWRLGRAALGPTEGLIAAAVLATLYPFVWLSRTTLVYGPAALALTVAATLAWAAGRPRARGRAWLEGAAWLTLALCAWAALEVAAASVVVRGAALAVGAGLVAAWRDARRRWPELAWPALASSAAWALVITTTLALRPPAIAAAGGLALLHVTRARRPLRAALAVAQVAAVAFVLLALLDPGDIRTHTLDRLSRYVRTDALSPGEVALRVLRLGGEPLGPTGSGYVSLAPGACLAAALGVLVVVGRRLDSRRRDLVALAGGWLALFLAGAIVSDYRPLRYFAVIGPPVAVLAAVGVGHLLGPARGSGRSRLPASVAAWGALVAPHALELIAGPRGLADLVPAAAAGGAAALGLWVVAPRLGPGVRQASAVALLVVATAPGALGVALDLARPSWSTREANAAAAAALGPGASLVGPHASVLALGHGVERRRAAWIDVSPDRAQRTIDRLRALGATHLALGVEQASSSRIVEVLAARGVRPALVAVFVPRSTPVLLLRFPWASELGYRPCDFEVRRSADDDGAEPSSPGPEMDPRLLLARVRALSFQGSPDRARRVLAESTAQATVSPEVAEAAARALQTRGWR